MNKYSKEIGPEEIQNFVKVSKSCKIDATDCKLESKFGKVSFDFSNFELIQGCDLHFRRLSGNGKICIKTGEEVKEYTVLSKISQNFYIPLNNTLEIEVFRPDDSIGEVSIIGLTLSYNYQEKENALSYNWKLLIAKCGKYNCLRMIDNRLFASEGAYIEDASIVKSIKTSPEGMTSIEDNKLKFNGSCEIIELEVSNDATYDKLSAPYVHREGASPVIAVPTVIEKSQINPAQVSYLLSDGQHIDNGSPFASNILYDSNTSNGLERSKFGTLDKRVIRCLNSNGKNYISLKKGGMLTIPISALQERREYIIAVNFKTISGNGKVSVGFSSGNEYPKFSTVISDNNFVDKYVNIETDTQKFPGSSFKLNVSMLDNSFGEVLISRVRVIDSLNNKQTISYSSPKISFNHNKKFVIVIPSYNNSKWCDKNIASAINQNYKDYRVIFMDDCSSDNTFEIVEKQVAASTVKDKFTLIKNASRVGALENLYTAIHSCDDDEIILTLDGDDWLANENVLNKLNEAYSSDDVWMTYGQYQNYPDGGTGVAQQIPVNIAAAGSFRQFTWCSTHLRTFYAWLFKNIKKEDLCYEGKFMAMTWDMAMMFPMLEMSGHRSKFISDFLYTYNLENPINDHKVNVKLQQDLDRYVRRLPRYQKLNAPIMKDIKQTNIGLLIIATNQYDRFIQGLISSADNYFINDPNVKVTYYVFSDKINNIVSKREVVQLHIDHRPFPYASMDRFRHFTNHYNTLSKENYLYYVDVDSLFVDYVSKDILGDLVGVRHCGYVNATGPFENNKQSVFYENPNKYNYYFGGGFSGGKSSEYLKLSSWCADMIDKDLANNIIPFWHDETALNRYFLDHPPNIVLSPSYHHPQSQIDRYKRLWHPESFPPKIMLLDKKHNQIR